MFAPAETTNIPNEPDNPNADAFANANTDCVNLTGEFQNNHCEQLVVNSEDLNENNCTISIGENPGTSGTQKNVSVNVVSTILTDGCRLTQSSGL